MAANFNVEAFPTINKIEGGVATKYDSEDRSLDALLAMAKGLVSA